MGNQFGFEQLIPFLERVGIGQGANLLSQNKVFNFSSS